MSIHTLAAEIARRKNSFDDDSAENVEQVVLGLIKEHLPSKNILDPEHERQMFLNCHELVRSSIQFRGTPLWSLVSHMTGHGSGYSHDVCKKLGWEPSSPAQFKIPRT